MSVENIIPIRIATSNKGKIEQARRGLAAADRVVIDAVFPTFDEDKIKESISQQELQHPFEYPLLISREKFKSLGNNGEKGLIVVSDSVAVANNGENWLVLNRDATEEEREKFLEIIKANGKITFVGAVTFGLLPNNQPISVMTFCEIPISHENLQTLSLPVPIEKLQELKDPEKPIKVGYLDHYFNQTNVIETDNFDSDTDEQIRARPYISGLTKDVLSIARSIAESQILLEPILGEFIARYPFNTISYYADTIGLRPEEILKFYKEISSEDSFFKKNGGNCSLHTIFLARRIEGLGYNSKVVIFPSIDPDKKNPDKDDGHSGLIIKKNNLFFLLDPGLSVPHILPFSPNIPLIYSFEYGENKKISILPSNSEDPFTFIMIVESKKRRAEFPVVGILSIEEFSKLAPQILFELHNMRRFIKVDFHDKRGRKLERILINLERGEVVINNQIFNVREAFDSINDLNIGDNLKNQLIRLLTKISSNTI